MALVADLSRIHERLDELFAAHQELLLEQQLHDARKALHVYRGLLELHMRHEEHRLLPAYQAIGPSPKWPMELYVGQHRRMRDLLDGAEQRLSELSGRGPSVRRGIISVLDHETTFKHLTEHHEGAERQGLLAALGAALDDTEQANLVEPSLLEWYHAEQLLVGSLARARREDRPH
jgi:hypothetical protein